jgi:glycosyltransferase involved in cell wall biosynthesis
MRVLHVSHTSQRGGAELALVRLLSSEPQWRASVCTPAGGDAFDGLPARGVLVQRDLPTMPGGGTRGKSPTLAAKYLAALRASARTLRSSPLMRGADLLHANSAAAAIVCALANRGRAVPLVVHLRDLVSVESLGRFGFEAFTRIGLVRADGVIANSLTTMRSAEDRLDARVQRVVLQSPSGVSRRVSRPAVGERVRTIGMIGRLQPWKGQHVFLEAFARTFGGTNVKALLAGAPLFGETAYEQQLRAQAAQLGIADQVGFLGHVEDVPAFVESVDVLVHASTRPEPLGQSVLQGLAYAKPVIATEGGGPSEWIESGTNGLLVPPGNAEALAMALWTLADSRDLRVRLASGAARTPGILTDDECVTAHAAFFSTVLDIQTSADRRHPR